MLATLLLQVYCLVNAGIPQCNLSLEVAGKLRLATVQPGSCCNCVHKEQYQEMLCKPQHNQTWVGAKLGRAFNCTRSVINLGCVALVVSFSGFHSVRRLICCID